jgi:hypothetical protein
MKHPETACDCVVAASPLAIQWRCPACGKTTIMKISTHGAVCDGGGTMRRVEPEAVSRQSTT